MKTLIVCVTLLGALSCKAIESGPQINGNLKKIPLNSSLQLKQRRTSLVGQVSQTSKRPRCKNICSKFQVTAFSVPSQTCPKGGVILVGITGGTPPFTLGGDFVGGGSDFFIAVGSLENGTYQLEVVDSNGCSSQQTITVNNTCPPPSCENFQFFARNIPISACPNNPFPGLIALSVEGATGPNIIISVSSDGGNTFETPEEVPLSDGFPTVRGPFPNGTYVIRAVDSGNPTCPRTQEVTVADRCVIPTCPLPFLFCCRN